MAITFDDFLYLIEKDANISKYCIKNPLDPQPLHSERTKSLGKSMFLSPDGRRLGVVLECKKLMVYDTDSLQLLKTKEHFSSLFLTNNISSSATGNLVYGSPCDYTEIAKQWSFSKDKTSIFKKNSEKFLYQTPCEYQSTVGRDKSNSYVYCLFENLHKLVFSGNTRELYLYHTMTRKRLHKVSDFFENFVTVCAKLDEYGRVLIGGWDIDFRVLDVSGGRFRPVRTVSVPGQIYGMGISRKGDLVACGGGSSLLMVFSVGARE